MILKCRNLCRGASLLVAVLFSPIALAEAPRAPDQIPGVTRVGAEDLVKLAETSPQLVLIDSRIRMDRRQGYLDGSISLPDTETSCRTLARLLRSKDHPALFYCNGVKCGRSATAARIARSCGYTRIYWYHGGFEDWKLKGFPYLKE